MELLPNQTGNETVAIYQKVWHVSKHPLNFTLLLHYQLFGLINFVCTIIMIIVIDLTTRVLVSYFLAFFDERGQETKETADDPNSG